MQREDYLTCRASLRTSCIVLGVSIFIITVATAIITVATAITTEAVLRCAGALDR